MYKSIRIIIQDKTSRQCKLKQWVCLLVDFIKNLCYPTCINWLKTICNFPEANPNAVSLDSRDSRCWICSLNIATWTGILLRFRSVAYGNGVSVVGVYWFLYNYRFRVVQYLIFNHHCTITVITGAMRYCGVSNCSKNLFQRHVPKKWLSSSSERTA